MLINIAVFSNLYTPYCRKLSIITLHSSIAAMSASQYKKKKLKFNKMLSILVDNDNAAANEQLTANITSNFPQYC